MILMIDNYDSFTYNIVQYCLELGADLKVIRNDELSLDEIIALNPSKIIISPGPATPNEAGICLEVIEYFSGKKPIFGICLGHQIIGLANGIPTYKMFNGHRGINHPVKNVLTGKGEITSQNHGFAVVKEDLENHPDFEITHLHLNDGTVAGMRMKSKNCFSVQYHPEASPGPHDSSYLFDQFIINIQSSKN